MQENEFEKRVQQGLEEFRLRPSGAVWQKVEEGIKKKKKRRAVFFIFLLAGLSLLGYSGYFLLNQSNQSLTEKNSTLPNNNDAIKENRSNQPKDLNTPVTDLPHEKDQKTAIPNEKIQQDGDEAKTAGEPQDHSVKNRTADLTRTTEEEQQP